ncbi:serine/threonine protein kinase [Malassezia brasiliensis]|uniref:Serine/threonine protein kinase n=1 Tax=Malassezia brasiliensis TaxID=1821822 RepID=A0AAF0DSY1_9BASI|nr:serine/threonine protein kinase [Malassezia brasiliensis]
MPLEHFGGPRLGEGSSRRAPRPLSEPGVLDARRAGVSRAASDAYAATHAREPLRTERGDPGDDEDRAVLSKLTGVSRSVSWGRAQAEANHRTSPSASASGDQTPKPVRSASARTPSGSRLRPHYTSATLSMSPTVSSNDIPENTELASQRSSPASSAAFSLRSLSSLGRHGSVREQDTHACDELRQSQHSPAAESVSLPAPTSASAPAQSPAPGELPRAIVLSPKQEASASLSPDVDGVAAVRAEAAPRMQPGRLDQALPPLPPASPHASPRASASPVPALDLAVPVSPRTPAACPEGETARVRPTDDVPTSSAADLSWSLPLRERRSVQEGALHASDLQFSIARKHAGSFQSRALLQPMSRSLYTLAPDDGAGGADASGSASDGRSRTHLSRFFSKLFTEPRASSAGSDTDSVPSFSPRASIAAASPVGAGHAAVPRDGGRSPLSDTGLQRTPYTSTSSLMQLTSSQLLPRRPLSPRASVVPTQDDDLSDAEEEHEIHGLTPRSATPARSLSPSATRHASVATLVVPPALAAPAPVPAPALGVALGAEAEALPRTHTIDDYEIGEDMGSGAYGFVRRARLLGDPPGAEDVVIKYIVKSCILADSWRRHRAYGTIPAEIFVLLQLQQTPYIPPPVPPAYIKDKAHWMQVRQTLLAAQQRGEATGHPGICKLLDFFEDEEYYYLVMPRFGDGQDLFEYVESSTYGLDPADVRNFLGQVCDVIAYMHANNIVHRDIKDENVILDRYKMTQLIDFGSAARLRANRTFDTFSGTMDYAAAEIIQGEKYTGPPQDVWAFGVMAYVLVCGECPFRHAQEVVQGLAPDSRPMQVLRHFCLEQHAAPPSGGPAVPHHETAASDGGGDLRHALDLIVQCLQLDPEQRPTAAELLRHRFLQGASGWLGSESRRSAEAPAEHVANAPGARKAEPVSTT